MSCFIELLVNIENQRWEKRTLNMNHCIAMKEHDATEQFAMRRKQEPFASQPLFCLLTMVYPDGGVEKLWCHSSLYSILTQIGYANHADSFTPPVDMASIEREWQRKGVNSSPTHNRMQLNFSAR